MNSVIDQIKDRVDMVDLIQGYVKLQKSGVNFKARCPFHNEKTPSFFVSPERRIFKCFGCNEGGSIFDFVMKLEGLEFPEALRVLAKRAGIELKKENREFETAKNRLYEICDSASAFFEKQLYNSNTGKQVLSYLVNARGLTLDTVKKWHLGYAPKSWTVLGEFLLGNGYQESEIFSAGLTIKSDDGRHYDRFRGRIVFPIFNLSDQVSGFTGRIFGEAEVESPKYINTPQTPIYDKSRILYGLNLARHSLKKNDRCILVEGNMDVIAAHQTGGENAVACSGTALTQEHLKLLKRYTDNLDLCFDFDLAGDSATRRGVDAALENGFSVNIIDLSGASAPDAEIKDPADYIKTFGGSAWQVMAQKRIPIAEYYLNRALQTHNPSTAQGKKDISKFVLPILASYENPVEKAYWISMLASKISISEEVLQQATAMQKKTHSYSGADLVTELRLEDSKRSKLEQAFVTLLLKTKRCVDLPGYSFLNQEYARIYALINDVKDEILNDDWPNSTDIDPTLKDIYNIMSLEAEQTWSQVDSKLLDEELGKLVLLLKREVVKEELARIQNQISLIRSGLDTKTLDSYLIKIKELSQILP